MPASKAVRISEIVVGQRHRKALGDIASLAESLANRGLLHPPVVTPGLELVCGFRRLEAAKQLGWRDIEVRVIDPDDALLAERDENEVRKDFTPSERVAIARAIEERIRKPQGRRTDRQESESEPLVNSPEVKTSRDVAAEKAGFESTAEYRCAAKVVDQGTPELVEAMDEGEVSVSAAAAVATLPEPQQKAAVAEGPGGVKRAARKVRDKQKSKPERNGHAGVTATPPDPSDGPPGFAKLWDYIGQFLVSLPELGGIASLLRDYPRHIISGTHGQMLSLLETVEGAIRDLEETYPWLKSTDD